MPTLRPRSRSRTARTLALLAALLPALAACSGTASSVAAEPPPVPIAPELALATFDTAWETVRDEHFDPTLNGVDWDAVRAELRPRAAEATTRAEVRAVVRDMLGRLGQSHFALLPEESLPAVQGVEEGVTPEAVAGGLGLDLRLREGALLVSRVDADGAAAAAGVRPGWSVERIGELDVAELLERLGTAELEPRRVAMHAQRRALEAAVGPIGSRVELVLRDGADRRVELELERAERPVTAHGFGNLATFYLRFEDGVLERDGARIGWIRFTNWFLPMVKPLDEAIDRMRGLDGIVLDLRGNGGGAAGMTMGLAGHFFAERTSFGSQALREGEVRYVAMPRRVDTQGELVEPFAGPLAILVDELTGSASEVFAGGLQSVGRARVFGETTAGAVLPSTVSTLPDGDALLHAIGDFETADGTALEGRGVIPDEVVPLTREHLLEGRDPQLEAALAWIAAASRT